MAPVFLLRYFALNESSGELSLRQDTPPGSYWLRVGVSDGVWPDVISGVRVHVRDLEEKAVLSSASLRLTGKRSPGSFSRSGSAPLEAPAKPAAKTTSRSSGLLLSTAR